MPFGALGCLLLELCCHGFPLGSPGALAVGLWSIGALGCWCLTDCSLLTEAEMAAQVAKIHCQQRVMETLMEKQISELEGSCAALTSTSSLPAKQKL